MQPEKDIPREIDTKELAEAYANFYLKYKKHEEKYGPSVKLQNMKQNIDNYFHSSKEIEGFEKNFEEALNKKLNKSTKREEIVHQIKKGIREKTKEVREEIPKEKEVKSKVVAPGKNKKKNINEMER